ncbi:hypothetical protein FF38_04527 [Lucilia cuprina]|uniref:Uncharacterized protein n=1 Tax=Lucilia cuprina TaxID=7375 RepID=A0A0L0CK31_LUCCU|nr:hypothetical protein FF38_04527 [Lucilia cuprina]
MKESNSMVEYLNTFSDVVEKINEVGIQLQDELLVKIRPEMLFHAFEPEKTIKIHQFQKQLNVIVSFVERKVIMLTNAEEKVMRNRIH